MKYKEFKNWYNNRVVDGCLECFASYACPDIIKSIDNEPFWKRAKHWKKIEKNVVSKIVEPSNALIEKARKEKNNYFKGVEPYMEETIKWISCKERLPKTIDDFLVIVQIEDYFNHKWNHEVDVATSNGSYIDNFWDTYNDWVEGNEVHILYWAELPKSLQNILNLIYNKEE